MMNIHPIVIKKSREGSLHSAMHVAAGQNIPVDAEHKKLAIAKHEGNVPLEKKIVFALNAAKFKH